ncbi:MAG: pirin family protein [Minwuia sp.]|nr:pirin family protein [Minwuia sp.]
MALIHERALRGHTRTGWLDSHHTFSFAGFRDPARMGHRALRVINQDRVIGGAGFGAHQHADMDILTYVITGCLAHEDSLGNGSIIRPGEIQRMSAGSGIRHSEMNASTTDGVHFLQIWIIPDQRGGPPSYEQKAIDQRVLGQGWTLIAGPAAEQPVVSLFSDTRVLLARPSAGAEVRHTFTPPAGLASCR